MTIYKFVLAVADRQIVFMPRGAEILDVGIQNGIFGIWAMVDPEQDKIPHTIEMFGTGHPMPQGTLIKRSYIGTVQDPPFVWHFFERS